MSLLEPNGQNAEKLASGKGADKKGDKTDMLVRSLSLVFTLMNCMQIKQRDGKIVSTLAWSKLMKITDD